MNKIPELFQAVINELVDGAKEVDESQIDKLVEAILAAKRVFVAGAGRSGFVARAFSNRLMHLGFTVYFVGDTTTPSIQSDDLLVIVQVPEQLKVWLLWHRQHKVKELLLQQLQYFLIILLVKWLKQ